MRLALAILGCFASSARAHAGGDTAESHADIEVLADKDTYFVGEPIRLRLRVGYDEIHFRDHVVPTYLQPMDVAAKVEAPWLRGWQGAVPYGDDPGVPPDPRQHVRIALNDGVVDAISTSRTTDQVRNPDLTWPMSSLEVVRAYVATEPGDLVVPAPTLAFTYASAFKDDLIHGRVPVDREDVLIRGAPLTLHVLPLPRAGRPTEFQGAIGSFTVTSDVDRRAVTVGEHFHVTLRIEGEGNLANVPTPRLDGLDGFHVYGAIDDKRPRARSIVYDVAVVRPEVRELPPIPFAYFDPAPPAAYRVVRTDRVPLEVRAVAGAAQGSAQKSDSKSGWLMGAMTALLALLVLGMARRARARVAVHPGAARQASAAALFRERVARPTADVAAAFAEFLAAHLDCPTAAVISPDLEASLLARNWAPELARRTATTMDRLVAIGYGGSADGTDVEAVRSLVEELAEESLSAQSPR